MGFDFMQFGQAASAYDPNDAGIYQQALRNTRLNTYTITSGSTSAITCQVVATEPPKAVEPDEITWLKRRVREIEWRP